MQSVIDKKRKTIAILLAFSLIVPYFINIHEIWATDEGGLCKHHPKHTAVCGYTKETEEIPCDHLHTNLCYDEEYLICDHADGCPESGSCSYAPAINETECGYNCPICSEHLYDSNIKLLKNMLQLPKLEESGTEVDLLDFISVVNGYQQQIEVTDQQEISYDKGDTWVGCANETLTLGNGTYLLRERGSETYKTITVDRSLTLSAFSVLDKETEEDVPVRDNQYATLMPETAYLVLYTATNWNGDTVQAADRELWFESINSPLQDAPGSEQDVPDTTQDPAITDTDEEPDLTAPELFDLASYTEELLPTLRSAVILINGKPYSGTVVDQNTRLDLQLVLNLTEFAGRGQMKIPASVKIKNIPETALENNAGSWFVIDNTLYFDRSEDAAISEYTLTVPFTVEHTTHIQWDDILDSEIIYQENTPVPPPAEITPPEDVENDEDLPPKEDDPPEEDIPAPEDYSQAVKDFLYSAQIASTVQTDTRSINFLKTLFKKLSDAEKRYPEVAKFAKELLDIDTEASSTDDKEPEPAPPEPITVDDKLLTDLLGPKESFGSAEEYISEITGGTWDQSNPIALTAENASTLISYIQVMDSALSEVRSGLEEQVELANMAANVEIPETVASTAELYHLQEIQNAYNQGVQQLYKIIESTDFNGHYGLCGGQYKVHYLYDTDYATDLFSITIPDIRIWVSDLNEYLFSATSSENFPAKSQAKTINECISKIDQLRVDLDAKKAALEHIQSLFIAWEKTAGKFSDSYSDWDTLINLSDVDQSKVLEGSLSNAEELSKASRLFYVLFQEILMAQQEQKACLEILSDNECNDTTDMFIKVQELNNFIKTAAALVNYNGYGIATSENISIITAFGYTTGNDKWFKPWNKTYEFQLTRDNLVLDLQKGFDADNQQEQLANLMMQASSNIKSVTICQEKFSALQSLSSLIAQTCEELLEQPLISGKFINTNDGKFVYNDTLSGQLGGIIKSCRTQQEELRVEVIKRIEVFLKDQSLTEELETVVSFKEKLQSKHNLPDEAWEILCELIPSIAEIYQKIHILSDYDQIIAALVSQKTNLSVSIYQDASSQLINTWETPLTIPVWDTDYTYRFQYKSINAPVSQVRIVINLEDLDEATFAGVLQGITFPEGFPDGVTVLVANKKDAAATDIDKWQAIDPETYMDWAAVWAIAFDLGDTYYGQGQEDGFQVELHMQAKRTGKTGAVISSMPEGGYVLVQSADAYQMTAGNPEPIQTESNAVLVRLAPSAAADQIYTTQNDSDTEGTVNIKWGPEAIVTGSTVPTEYYTNGEEPNDSVGSWDLRGLPYRYLQLPLMLNIAGIASNTSITIPYYIDLDPNDKYSDYYGFKPKATCSIAGINQNKWIVNANENDNTVVLTSREDSGHRTLTVNYTVDTCFIADNRDDPIFNSSFNLRCSITKNGEVFQEKALYGTIATDCDLEIGEYHVNWGGSTYTLNDLGAVDRATAYIPQWSDVYKKYFDVESFDSNYIYDIAPFVITPKGQQSYWINGSITPNNNGEVISALWIMDTKATEKVYAIEKDFQKENGSTYKFALNGLKSAITSDIIDTVKSKSYVLYFLVRYPKTSLPDSTQLTAHLELFHQKVIDGVPTEVKEKTVVLYDGKIDIPSRIYWANYETETIENYFSLSQLKQGLPSNLELTANYLCLNEARPDFNRSTEYQLEMIVDLQTLSSPQTQILGFHNDNDYYISGFNISMIDAPANWSQNNNGVPSVAYNQEKFVDRIIEAQERAKTIKVYGSRSLKNNNWELAYEIDIPSVWAENESMQLANKNKYSLGTEYVRLKLVYDSRLTTTVRLFYTVSLRPEAISNYINSIDTDISLASWLNFAAYKQDGTKDLGPGFYRYVLDPSVVNTMDMVRQYDDDYPLPGYENIGNSVDDGYTMRAVTTTNLHNSTGAAGIILSRALYDNQQQVIGKHQQNDRVPEESYSCQNVVNGISEVTYILSGVVTNGAGNAGDLQNVIDNSELTSPYRASKIRYYCVLPEGMRLDTDIADPSKGEEYQQNYYWIPYPNTAISPASSLYGYMHEKTLQDGDPAVPISPESTKSVAGVKLQYSSWLCKTYMYWDGSGTATILTDAGVTKDGRQVVVIDRTISGALSQFNMWEAPTFFYGKGIAFSAIPKYGTGSLPTGEYKADFWCQYLDADDNPIPIDPTQFAVSDKGPIDLIFDESSVTDSLLYLSSTFTNKNREGNTSGSIQAELTSENTSGITNNSLTSNGTYRYQLNYNVGSGYGKDVVLWCNIENAHNKQSDWLGTVTGVDLNGEKAEVYVRNSYFDYNGYVGSASKATLSEDGWIKVDDPEHYADWYSVRAVTISFTGREFVLNDSATVYIEMKAPAETDYYIGDSPKVEGVTDYYTYTELIVSDVHSAEASGAQKEDLPLCWLENFTAIPYKTQIDIPSLSLPKAGGTGTTFIYYTGWILLMTSTYLICVNKKNKKGRLL